MKMLLFGLFVFSFTASAKVDYKNHFSCYNGMTQACFSRDAKDYLLLSHAPWEISYITEDKILTYAVPQNKRNWFQGALCHEFALQDEAQKVVKGGYVQYCNREKTHNMIEVLSHTPDWDFRTNNYQPLIGFSGENSVVQKKFNEGIQLLLELIYQELFINKDQSKLESLYFNETFFKALGSCQKISDKKIQRAAAAVLDKMKLLKQDAATKQGEGEAAK